LANDTTTSTPATPVKMKAVEIPCCLCGTMILPNAANQCRTCLSQEVDVRSILQRGPNGGNCDIIIYQCRQCRKFGRTEKLFSEIDLESPEMMALCLKKIPALAPNATPKFRLADAMFIWTEPHSMRIKLRLTVQTEIENVKVQQRVVVVLVIKFKQCPECNREYTNRTWHAVVQLRQRREEDDAPRKGLALLEMALAKNATIRKQVINMDSTRNGFDFYFLQLQEAQHFSAYLARVAPMRIKTTNKLVSTDVKSNKANLKHTVTCDMVPLCRDDLIMVHKSATKPGNVSGRLALVMKVSSAVHLLDAAPKRNATQIEMGEVGPDMYYKAGAEKVYKLVCSPRRLIRFIVLDVELVFNHPTTANTDTNNNDNQLYKGPSSGVEKYALAEVEVVRESDFGINDESFTCTSHLGNLLQVGDVCLGYDLTTFVLSGTAEFNMEKFFHHRFTMPDIVLVKKIQGNNDNNNNDNDDRVAPKEVKEEGTTKTKKKNGQAKKRERRRLREEKKTRALEEAAERMGFFADDAAAAAAAAALPDETTTNDEFERELQHDPALAQELHAAEQNL